MNPYEYWFNLRDKENRTFEEELLLLYRNQASALSNILIDESKRDISSHYAINKIRYNLNKTDEKTNKLIKQYNEIVE